jgi:photosystem II stability/assembly factor-like uncharacterized protein
MRPLLLLCLPACLLVSSFSPAMAAVAVPGFHAVYSVDGTDVWAVGDGGVFYRSLDGGATWFSGALGDKTLRGVAARGFNVIVVGDSGKIWRSQDSGGSWSLTVASGAPRLNAIEMPSDQVAYAVGNSGSIYKSTDGGGSWSTLSSGTTQALLAVEFLDWDDQWGWAVGAGGTVLQTDDGGANWGSLPIPTTRDLLAVSPVGAMKPPPLGDPSFDLWVVGTDGTAFRKYIFTSPWTQINLNMEWRSDVRGIHVTDPSLHNVFLIGGGGFVRSSTDDGSTWSFPVHQLQAAASDVFFVGARGWICSQDTRAILRTTDSGATWSLTAGTLVNRDWDFRAGTPGGTVVRGSTFSMAGTGHSIWCALGDRVFVSRDEGESWIQAGNPFTGVDASNAFLVSQTDSLDMVAAVTATVGGVGDRIIKSTNGGGSWNIQFAKEYGEYGIPLEMDPERPDTLYFGADADVMYRSTDFGTTWLPQSATPFVSPCDIILVPGTGAQIIQVGDGITGVGNGRLLRSTDGGVTFVSTMTTNGSEVPGMASSSLRPWQTFATNWPSGGVLRSTNYGQSWTQVHNAGSAWGVDIAGDDPNCVIFGVYGGGVYLALDGGPAMSSWENQTLSGTNYSFFARDRQLILAEMSDGIYKLRATYAYSPDASAQTLDLSAPAGGEIWQAGSVHQINWSAHKLAIARLEYRLAPGEPWQLVADVAGYAGTYAWTVPGPATTQAMVRVRDAWDGSPADSSGFFTVTTPVGVGDEVTPGLTLAQNLPNPFLGATRIRYTLPARADVALEVFNVHGQRVATLVRGEQAAGSYSASFPAVQPGGGLDRLPSGIYMYRLRAGDRTITRKMVMMR